MDKAWLKKETQTWVKEKIIQPAQAKKILSKYNDLPEEGFFGKNKLISVVSTIGAILIGLGMLLFVASNWQAMPASLKLIILYGSTFGFYFAGWKVQQKNFHKVGLSLLFLGSIMVGVTLALTAQIFNIEANFMRFFLIWFVAVAPLSYVFRSKPTLLLSHILFACFLAAFMGGGGDFDDLAEGFFDGFGVFLFYGLTIYGIGFLHERTAFKEFKGSYQGAGIFFTLLMGFALVASELRIVDEVGNHWLSYIFLLTACLTVMLTALHMKQTKGTKHELIWSLLALFMALGAWALSFTLQDVSWRSAEIFVYLIPLHFVYFALLLVTLLSGYYNGITYNINLGLVFFVLYIGYFYFTTVFAYLPRSLSFVLGGLLLIGGGLFLEKKRRSLIGEIKHKK